MEQKQLLSHTSSKIKAMHKNKKGEEKKDIKPETDP